MDFFKSVFSDDPLPSEDSPSTPTSPPKSQSLDPKSSSPFTSPNPSPKVSSITNAWTFGSSFIRTIASKSESAIETYRRDLEEFGSGLRKETAVIREVASRAVKELPTSLEAGAAVAQESLESVGQAIDNLGNTMSEIIAHGKDSILAGDSDSETYDTKQFSSIQNLNSNAKPYSRLDAQIRTIQCDMKTYCEEPDDLDEYNEWKLGFVLDESGEEIENLIENNGVIEEIYNEIVPSRLDHDTFWNRYFYKAYKVMRAEEARAKLVKKAISGEEEEELTWDVDDDDFEENDGPELKGNLEREIEEKDSSEKSIGNSQVENEEKILKSENFDKVVSESKSDSGVDEKVTSEGRLDEPESASDKMEAKSDEKLGSEGKTDNGGSCKDSDFSVVSSQPSSHEDEDLSWDEIEDIGNNDEIRVTESGSPDRAHLRKRLSAAEVDEDLTWDIEDDDEPVKS